MEIAQERSHPVATVRDVDEAFSNYSGSRETLIKFDLNKYRCLRTLPRIILTSLADFSAKSSDGHVLIRDVFDAVVQQYESNKEEPPTFESILNQANSLHELGLIYNYGTVCENSKVKLNFLRSLLE
ncbi:hypothetical protein RF11_00695 [Thelohanellus kitauei]|uniref:Uncharacterized protein n=1 Tax=Thelohanellus kitauei TaxID=669202 RepID=A0A0C2NKX5_THEKT|nr:hypothetical protein RF11_00695 [Thelohanellus kitauei]